MYTSLAEEYDALMTEFGWDRVAIISATDDLWRTTAEATKTVMEANNKRVFYRMVASTVAGTEVSLTLSNPNISSIQCRDK